MTPVENGSSTVAATPEPSTLADELSSLFGDDFSGSSADESPGTDTSTAGAPPAADPSAAPETTTDAPPEGVVDAEHAGTPPADAANQAPDDDPLKDAKPLTYVVNGETRTAEGLMVLGDRGAIVPAEHLQKLQQRLSERDHLFEKSQAEYQRYSALEQTFNKLTEWNAGKDAQGNDRVLTGADGLETQRVLLGQTMATLNTLAAALDDPNQFAALVDVQQDPATGQFYILPNATAVAALRTRAELAAVRAEQQARSHFASIRSQLPQRGQPTPTVPAADAPIESIAMPTVEQAITDLKVTGFTAEDKQFFASQLPRYVRPTTPQEKAQNLGSRIVDESFIKLIQREATRRAESSQTAAQASQIAQENARRLAQAATGKRPTTGTKPTPQTPPRVSVAAQRATDADDAWDRAEKAAAASMKQRTA
jgi:hypothetical protein